MFFMWSNWIVLLAAGVYAFFLACEPLRLVRQRNGIQRIRELLQDKLGFKGLQIGHGWDNKAGFRIMVCVWNFTLAVSSITFCSEGDIWVGINMANQILVFSYCLATDKSKEFIVYVARLSMSHQAIVLWYFEFSDTRVEIICRSIVVRAIAILIFFESLEESFLHLLLYSILFQARYRTSVIAAEQGIILLPLKMFFLGVLPLRTLGISEWISSSAGTESDFSTQKLVLRMIRSLSAFSCLLPMYILYSSFVQTSLTLISLGTGAGFCLAAVLLRTPRFGVMTNRWISPYTVAFNKYPVRPPLLLASSPQRRNAMAAGVLLLLLVLWYLKLETAALVVASLAVIALLMEDVPYNRLQANLFFLNGGLLIIGCNNAWFSGMITFHGAVSTFAALTLVSSKEVIFSKMAHENEIESFLSHSLKQKFASVGAALEHVLLLEKDLTTGPLLRVAMMECRMGHARCHANTLYRKLDQGERRVAEKRTFENLHEQLTTATPLASYLIKSPGTEFAPLAANNAREPYCCVETDWEIVHLILTELARKRHWIKRVSCRDGVVYIQLDRAAALGASIVYHRLLEEIHGRIAEDLFLFEARMQSAPLPTPPQPQSPPPPLSPTSRSRFLLELGGTHDMLSSLCFGLLDDNGLIRKNFARLLQVSLGVPPDRIITRGETERDCHDFAREICDAHVDIAIFDQNLDFDQDDGDAHRLKGIELALEAKQLGFQGCLILHSSDVNLSSLLSEGVFHGAIEKSADSGKFVQAMAEAWTSFQQGKSV